MKLQRFNKYLILAGQILQTSLIFESFRQTKSLPDSQQQNFEIFLTHIPSLFLNLQSQTFQNIHDLKLPELLVPGGWETRPNMLEDFSENMWDIIPA